MQGAESMLVLGMLTVEPLTSCQGCDPAEAKFGLSALLFTSWEGVWLSPTALPVQHGGGLARARGWRGKGQISAPLIAGQHCGADNGLVGPWPGLGTASATVSVAGEHCRLRGVTVAPLPPHGQSVWTCGAPQP